MSIRKAFYRIDKPEQIDALLTGISFECPLGGKLPAGCVVAELRELPVTERLDRLALMTADEKLSLYHEHLSCLHSHEAENAA